MLLVTFLLTLGLDSEPHQIEADLSKMARNQLEKMALELFIQLKNCHNKEWGVAVPNVINLSQYLI